MLRTSGDVLYVGKATSLHDRVNSHFRKQHGVDERALEMLSQARALSFDVTATPLEAALLEADDIKRHRPPYNLALALDDRAVWFASRDLSDRSPRPSKACPLGPLVSVETLDQFGALARADRAALGSGRWGPDAATFHAGYERLCAAHPELSRLDLSPYARLLRLGARLWREGRRNRDVDDDQDGAMSDRRVTAWTPELVHVSLEWIALRAALAHRRAIWLTRLVDASVVWREPGAARARLMVIERGEIVLSADADSEGPPPIPPGYERPVRARRELFTLACFDRLRVLNTELKRLVAAGAPVALRFGPTPALADTRLAAALWWL
jgi:DNA polymerase-3 subunit epsilon